MIQISPLASVSPEAKLGKNIIVEPFAVIHSDVVIGDNCLISSNAIIYPGARIGNDCRIFPGAIISSIPQDMKFGNEYTLAIIGNNVTIREYVTVNRGTQESNETVVGSNSLLMSYVHVAHDSIIGNNVILVNSVNVGGHVVVDDHAVIGGNCAIHQFNKVGKHAMVAAGTIVRKDIPPYVTAGRSNVSYMGINKIGLKRRGFSAEQISLIQSIYKILFQDPNTISDSLLIIEKEIPDSIEKNEVLSFIRNTKRGIMKGYRKSQMSSEE